MHAIVAAALKQRILVIIPCLFPTGLPAATGLFSRRSTPRTLPDAVPGPS